MKLLSFGNDSNGGAEPPPPPREGCGDSHTAAYASYRPSDARVHGAASPIAEWAAAARALTDEAALQADETRRLTLLAAIGGLAEAIGLRAQVDVLAETRGLYRAAQRASPTLPATQVGNRPRVKEERGSSRSLSD